MGETGHLLGAATVRLGDQFDSLTFLAPRHFLTYTLVYLVFSSLMFLLMGLFMKPQYFSGFVCGIRCGCYVYAAEQFLNVTVIPVMFVIVLAVVTVIYQALVQIFAFFRLSSPRRELSYMIDEIEIEVKDQLGFSQKIPWSAVKKCKRVRGVFMLQIRPRAWRYVPVRAFSTADQEVFARLATRAVKN